MNERRGVGSNVHECTCFCSLFIYDHVFVGGLNKELRRTMSRFGHVSRYERERDNAEWLKRASGRVNSLVARARYDPYPTPHRGSNGTGLYTHTEAPVNAYANGFATSAQYQDDDDEDDEDIMASALASQSQSQPRAPVAAPAPAPPASDIDIPSVIDLVGGAAGGNDYEAGPSTDVRPPIPSRTERLVDPTRKEGYESTVVEPTQKEGYEVMAPPLSHGPQQIQYQPVGTVAPPQALPPPPPPPPQAMPPPQPTQTMPPPQVAHVQGSEMSQVFQGAPITEEKLHVRVDGSKRNYDHISTYHAQNQQPTSGQIENDKNSGQYPFFIDQYQRLYMLASPQMQAGNRDVSEEEATDLVARVGDSFLAQAQNGDGSSILSSAVLYYRYYKHSRNRKSEPCDEGEKLEFMFYVPESYYTQQPIGSDKFKTRTRKIMYVASIKGEVVANSWFPNRKTGFCMVKFTQ